MQHHDLLSLFGKETLTDETLISAEIFISRVYGVQDCDSANMTRTALFHKAQALETHPPTRHALLLFYKASSLPDSCLAASSPATSPDFHPQRP